MAYVADHEASQDCIGWLWLGARGYSYGAFVDHLFRLPNLFRHQT